VNRFTAWLTDVLSAPRLRESYEQRAVLERKNLAQAARIVELERALDEAATERARKG
jgi:hypothetical protein